MESMHDSPIISGDTLREIISKAPRNLNHLDAELLFVDRNYILHYLDGNRHIYKSLTSDILRRAFDNEPADTGWLPENVIRHGSSVLGDWVVCFFPQQRYRLQIQSEQLYVPLPSFVFVGISSSYYVWAVKKIRFNSQLLIHHAPLPNVMNDGRVCWGNICPLIASLSTIESTWWKFIGSTFNQDYTQGKSIKFDNVVEQLKLQNRRARISNRSRYPISDLIPIRDNLTVEEAVEYVTKSTK
ncbi:hypothetical protein [Pleurocapsa sp. PCC 7319]|uniref:hypothetical protein n=1 Tax=Pleurocapsa sp. PCC 7319 TaxID=118161 RepID=UPI00036C0D8C|nr:hypothetical protein [Pleurocapsa sp. PCC 7319]